MARLKALIREIHRRSIWQVLGIYLVGAWLGYQIILGLTEGGILPDWFPGVAVGLFIVGLPLVIATAFVQEGVGPTRSEETAAPGVADGPAPAAARPSPRDPERSLARILTWRVALAAGVFVFTLAGLVAITASLISTPGDDHAPGGERSLAVLPLENMSPVAEDSFFTAGIHEEIITRLFGIEQIRTLARASVTPYAGSAASLESIARELGVNYVLVGSVRRAGDRSRVSVSLVEPRSGQQLWAETYQARGTDIFATQASIAANVATALEAELSPDARKRLASLPTSSAAAYDQFLRARTRLNRSYGEESSGQAIEWFEAAIDEDPAFALAHAYLGIAHLQHYWFHYDHSDARRDTALAHIRTALELDPELPEAHLAMARYHYWGRLDYDAALQDLERAAEGLPSDPDIPLVIGSVHRRAGRIHESVESYRRAAELDPRFWHAWWNMAESHVLLRQYDEAFEALERAADAGMTPSDVWTLKAEIRLRGLADPRAALSTLDSVPGHLATGEYDPVRARVESLVRLGETERALAAVDTSWVRNQFIVRPPTLLRALVHVRAGDPAAAAAAFDSAATTLQGALDESPGDVRVLGALGIALAGAGEGARGVELAERAARELPPEREAWRGMARLEDLAIARRLAGLHDQAVATLQRLLEEPYSLSREAVASDPLWAPLRDRPAFRALVGDGA